MYKFIKDKRGSETVEFVGTFMLLLFLVISLVTIFAYVYKVSEVNYVCRRAVRLCEVNGEYDATEVSALVTSLSNGKATVKSFEILSGQALGPNGEIQLRTTFKITLNSRFEVALFSTDGKTVLTGDDGVSGIPIRTSVQGMSEVYWQDLD